MPSTPLEEGRIIYISLSATYSDTEPTQGLTFEDHLSLKSGFLLG